MHSVALKSSTEWPSELDNARPSDSECIFVVVTSTYYMRFDRVGYGGQQQQASVQYFIFIYGFYSTFGVVVVAMATASNQKHPIQLIYVYIFNNFGWLNRKLVFFMHDVCVFWALFVHVFVWTKLFGTYRCCVPTSNVHDDDTSLHPIENENVPTCNHTSPAAQFRVCMHHIVTAQIHTSTTP